MRIHPSRTVIFTPKIAEQAAKNSATACPIHAQSEKDGGKPGDSGNVEQDLPVVLSRIEEWLKEKGAE